MRFLFYSHDGLGLGHTRRNLGIADAVTKLQPDAAVLMATGLDSVRYLGIPSGVGVLKLPGLRKLANEAYSGRNLPISFTELVTLRSALLKAAVESFRPHVLLADKHPFGVGEELLPALKVMRAIGGRTVLGLRDILDSRETMLREWARRDIANRIPRYYDRVLVYGDRAIFDPVAAYDFPPALARRTVFCGYVINRTRFEWRAGDAIPGHSPQRPTVVATAGGGQDGVRLLRCFLRAAAGMDWNTVVVTGSETPTRERKSLEAQAGEIGASFRSFLPALSNWFEKIDTLVSMGGYNTILEAVAAGTPTICVPRIVPRVEQLLRAIAFAKLGLLRLIHPGDLDPLGLRHEIEEALRSSHEELKRRARAIINFDGARAAALQIIEAASETEGGFASRPANEATGSGAA